MDRKILSIMMALVVVAIIVVAFVTVAAGGIRSSGGFTKLFDQLENPTPSVTYQQYLRLPSAWTVEDTKVVSDRIVDMYLSSTTTIGATTIYTHVLYFTYIGDKYTDAERGTMFYVPSSTHHLGYLPVNHGLFSLSVSSSANLSEEYSIGDVISLKTTLVADGSLLAFGSWSLK